MWQAETISADEETKSINSHLSNFDENWRAHSTGVEQTVNNKSQVTKKQNKKKY